MSFSLILFIALHVFTLIYCLELLRRLHHRSREHNLKETKHTLPFGFIRLRSVVTLYIVFYLVWVFLTFFLYFNYS